MASYFSFFAAKAWKLLQLHTILAELFCHLVSESWCVMVGDLRSAWRRSKCLFHWHKGWRKAVKELRKYKNLSNQVKAIKTHKWVIIQGKGRLDPCEQGRGSVAKDVIVEIPTAWPDEESTGDVLQWEEPKRTSTFQMMWQEQTLS